MALSEQQSEIVRRVRAGTSRRLQTAAAAGGLDLPPHVLFSLQVGLAQNEDPEISTSAQESLERADLLDLLRFLEKTEDRAALVYFASRDPDAAVMESIVRNPSAPSQALALLLPRLPQGLLKMALYHRDLVIEDAALLDSLDAGHKLDDEMQRRVTELRGVVAAAEEIAAPPPVEPPAEDEWANEDWSEEEFGEVEGEAGHGMSEGQIRSMPVSARLKLSRGAPRSLRNVLIRDTNPTVALSVLTSNSMPDSELEAIANNRNVLREVLEGIAEDRRLPRKRGICMALSRNPKVPKGTAIRLLANLSVRELKSLAADHSAPAAVRNRAKQLYTIKTS